MSEKLWGTGIDEAAYLEECCFRKPWGSSFLASLADNKFMRLRGTYDAESGELMGYCCYSVIFEDCELMRICTQPRFRRKGVAAGLLDDLIADARASGCDRIFLEVRKSNRGAISLYESRGFAYSYTRYNYYENGEDALVYQLSLKGDA
ncbi:MAG: GNAT family N-acetyltransferase [Clostridia bacterium]|nr:GNAT family N-acetyltransferase [Clostridia bacterium]